MGKSMILMGMGLRHHWRVYGFGQKRNSGMRRIYNWNLHDDIRTDKYNHGIF